jgi:hypothetical protein
MIIFAALVLTVLSFTAVAVPFFRNGDNGPRAWMYEFEDSSTDSETGATLAKQLETDLRTGILSVEDYQAQQTALQGAVEVPGGDKKADVSTVDDEIESRIARLRGGQTNPVDDIEDRVRQLRRTPPAAPAKPAAAGVRQKKARFCPQCGARAQSDGSFCTQCGEPLT